MALEEIREKHKKELLDRGLKENVYEDLLNERPADPYLEEIDPKEFEKYAEEIIDPDESLEKNILNAINHLRSEADFKWFIKMPSDAGEKKVNVLKKFEEGKADCNIWGGTLVGVLRAAGIPARLEREKDFPIHSSVKLDLGVERPEVSFYADHFTITTKGVKWVLSDNSCKVYHRKEEKGTENFPSHETELEKEIEKHIDEKGLPKKEL